jgi:membrane-associated phospholipid phosphatase
MRIIHLRAVLLLAAFGGVSGCGSLPDGTRWGAAATLTPGWNRVGESALDAARSPWVWAPLAGAAVLQVGSWDEDLAEWAREETPVFGSESSAADWSDDLRTAAVAGYAVSVLATPSGAVDGDWFAAKARGVAVGAGAFGATAGITDALKSATSRERPNGRDDASFPSGHASTAAVLGTLTARNLQHLDLRPATRTALEIGAGAITAGTAWARVEAGAHYPSDVLAGVALGNFMGAFFTQAFLGLEPGERLALSAEPTRGGATLRWQLRF